VEAFVKYVSNQSELDKTEYIEIYALVIFWEIKIDQDVTVYCFIHRLLQQVNEWLCGWTNWTFKLSRRPWTRFSELLCQNSWSWIRRYFQKSSQVDDCLVYA